jgi:hypothetical protein
VNFEPQGFKSGIWLQDFLVNADHFLMTQRSSPDSHFPPTVQAVRKAAGARARESTP